MNFEQTRPMSYEEIQKAKFEEARIAANALEASEAASSLAPKDKMLARRKSETEEILEIKKIEEEQKQVQIDAKKAEEPEPMTARPPVIPPPAHLLKEHVSARQGNYYTRPDDQ